MTMVMVTGHRPVGIGGYRTPNPTEQWVRENLRSVLNGFLRKYRGDLKVMSGMAIGTDLIFAEVALSLAIPVYAAVPFTGQESKWPDSSQRHYHNLLRQCEKVLVVCEPGYAPWKLLARNKFMVGRAQHAIAVWNGEPEGGTAHAVRLIGEKGITGVHINPVTLTVGPL
jgi:uncharacterized phage-like protein YoqJ